MCLLNAVRKKWVYLNVKGVRKHVESKSVKANPLRFTKTLRKIPSTLLGACSYARMLCETNGSTFVASY